MPAPVYKSVIVASSRPRRPELRVQPILPTSHTVTDDSWMIFGVLALVVCGLVGAFILGRATSAPAEAPVSNIALAPPLPLPPPNPPVIRQTYAPRQPAPARVSFNQDYVAPRVTGITPTLPRPAAPIYTSPAVMNVPPPAPVDYAAKDRQIHDLQQQMDRIDEQILFARAHPSNYSYLGTYNGPGARYGEESPFKKYLDGLDKQRNDLRREKWRLEGR